MFWPVNNLARNRFAEDGLLLLFLWFEARGQRGYAVLRSLRGLADSFVDE